jgi:TatA/E family protein of Tat protein translocase
MLLFGAKRLPDLARSFGKSIKEFKKGAAAIEEDINSVTDSDEPEPAKNGAGTAAKPKAAGKEA